MSGLEVSAGLEDAPLFDGSASDVWSSLGAVVKGELCSSEGRVSLLAQWRLSLGHGLLVQADIAVIEASSSVDDVAGPEARSEPTWEREERTRCKRTFMEALGSA